MDDDELLDTIIQSNMPADETDDDPVVELQRVPIDEAIQALEKLRTWCLQSPIAEDDFMRQCTQLASRLQRVKLDGLQQPTIKKFFLPVDTL